MFGQLDHELTELGHHYWWIWPFAMCLVLTGIHGYLGIHILERKVIFVDLALAQIAALGTVVAILLGYDPQQPGDTLPLYGFSLAFTFLGAAVFSMTRMRQDKIPHEALIGITYATASAVALLILARLPEGADHVRHMLVGDILVVRWHQVFKTAGLYGVIGIFHWACRHRFFRLTLDPAGAEEEGMNVRLWDFLFYMTFGFVITSSVSVAGVLLVFSYLVVPACIAVLLASSLKARVILAWVVGTLVSAAGIGVSTYGGDLPTGPSIVACFSGFLLLAGILYFIKSARRRMMALLRVGVGIVGVAGLVEGAWLLRKPAAPHEHGADVEAWLTALRSQDESTVIEAIHHLEETNDPHAWEALQGCLNTPLSDRVMSHALEAVGKLRLSEAIPALRDLVSRTEDDFIRLEIAKVLIALRNPSAIEVLISVFERSELPMARQEAGELLGKITGMSEVPEGWGRWWSEHRDHLRWNERRQVFE